MSVESDMLKPFTIIWHDEKKGREVIWGRTKADAFFRKFGTATTRPIDEMELVAGEQIEDVSRQSLIAMSG